MTQTAEFVNCLSIAIYEFAEFILKEYGYFSRRKLSIFRMRLCRSSIRTGFVT